MGSSVGMTLAEEAGQSEVAMPATRTSKKPGTFITWSLRRTPRHADFFRGLRSVFRIGGGEPPTMRIVLPDFGGIEGDWVRVGRHIWLAIDAGLDEDWLADTIKDCEANFRVLELKGALREIDSED